VFLSRNRTPGRGQEKPYRNQEKITDERGGGGKLRVGGLEDGMGGGSKFFLGNLSLFSRSGGKGSRREGISGAGEKNGNGKNLRRGGDLITSCYLLYQK